MYGKPTESDSGQSSRHGQDGFGRPASRRLPLWLLCPGDYDAESDVDILVLADVPREKLAAYKKPFLKATSDLGLEYDVVVTVTLKDTDTFEKYLDAVPFYQNVRKEGVPLAV